MRLAQEIDDRIQRLTKLVDDAIANETTSGRRLPAATTQGQYEQAMNWIDDPRFEPNGVGMLTFFCSQLFIIPSFYLLIPFWWNFVSYLILTDELL